MNDVSITPRVSVVIPCYQAAWSIRRTLRSVMAQRFTPFEIILVDDGSTDALDAAIEPYADRIRLVRQDNHGLAAARNRGIALARADLVAPLDADDLWHPDYLADLVAALDGAPAAPFAFAGSFRIDEDDRLLPDLHLRRAPRHDFAGLVSLNSVGSGSAAVFRRAMLLAAGGYDPSLRDRAAQGAEDWKLLVHLAAIATPVPVSRKLVAYRLTRAGMSQARPQRQLAAIDAVIDDLARDFPAAPRRLFRDARTMMTAWLLPAFLRNGMMGQALREAWRGYVLNPLWWRNPELLLVHTARLRMALRARPEPLGLLSDWTDEDGSRPFGFLSPSGTG
ncbi:glycosyltransferase family 2 protein [uncultured Sphingomonas sp.]|uniref:glycosyltransferase family 2 protein n=1 Tax=uncultured Sphingomonas sp. TaxID=158754 RepID=UPI0035CA8DDB